MTPRTSQQRDRDIWTVVAVALSLCLVVGVAAIATVLASPTHWIVLLAVAAGALVACLAAGTVVATRSRHARSPAVRSTPPVLVPDTDGDPSERP